MVPRRAHGQASTATPYVCTGNNSNAVVAVLLPMHPDLLGTVMCQRYSAFNGVDCISSPKEQPNRGTQSHLITHPTCAQHHIATCTRRAGAARIVHLESIARSSSSCHTKQASCPQVLDKGCTHPASAPMEIRKRQPRRDLNSPACARQNPHVNQSLYSFKNDHHRAKKKKHLPLIRNTIATGSHPITLIVSAPCEHCSFSGSTRVHHHHI